MRSRKVLRAIAAAGIALGAVLASTGTASAAEKDGWLTSGELGLFCNSNQSSSVFDLYYGDFDFSDDYFKGSQSCAGQKVNDNTASYANRDAYDWTVHTDWKGNGQIKYLTSGAAGNLTGEFKNSISSAYIA
ncbi:hypothetical protein ACN20G_06205 [Streptomyces sp. BI20]|uniref:hypothetical protein n=1 Tax=Streptomyces sp. BI20 TaxID=3403460 RepID=UPI003C75320C